MKIYIAIFLSLITINVLGPKVFLGSTPRLNPFMADNLLYSSRQFLSFINPLDNKEETSNLSFTELAPGVEAAEDPQTKRKYLKVKDGVTVNEKIETLPDGSVVKLIEVP